MKPFFQAVLGGLAIFGVGAGIMHGSGWLWRNVQAFIPSPSDGTSISGFSRTIRYTAIEEEDSVDMTGRRQLASSGGEISAAAYIIKDLKTGKIRAEYNSQTLIPIASLTKLVTAVVAIRHMDPNEPISITPDIMKTYGNTAQFRKGEIFRSADMLYPLLMVSSNDAAEALANKYGRKEFVRAMNSWTQSIGAYRTYFLDPSGLSDSNVSTAQDLAIILDWIRINEPSILATTLLKTKDVRTHTWVNPTHFLNWSDYLGGKNGYTSAANRTGSSLFALGPDKDPYAVVVLGSESRDGDVIKLLGKVK